MAHNPPITNLIPGEYGYPFQLKARYANFIGGEWVPPLSGDYFVNLTPVTGRPLCEVASSGRDDIDTALDAAHAARAGWGGGGRRRRSGPRYCIALPIAWSKTLSCWRRWKPGITASPSAKPWVATCRWGD